MTIKPNKQATKFELSSAIIRAQRLINNGSIWRFEGSIGRATMASIKAGQLMCAKEQHTDYWGNIVPSRYMLKAGSFGTREFVAEHYGEEYAAALEAVT